MEERWHIRVDDDDVSAGVRHEMTRSGKTRTAVLMELIKEALAHRRYLRDLETHRLHQEKYVLAHGEAHNQTHENDLHEQDVLTSGTQKGDEETEHGT